MIKGRDVWWEDEMEHAETQVVKEGMASFNAAEMDAEDPLFILYTSGVPVSRKAWCTLVPDTCFGPLTLLSMYFNMSRDKFIFVQPTSVDNGA
jgi:acyl-coenzyme A synthetase/AMP-(fatty) acid ligase